jgi:hypothetical protein
LGDEEDGTLGAPRKYYKMLDLGASSLREAQSYQAKLMSRQGDGLTGAGLDQFSQKPIAFGASGAIKPPLPPSLIAFSKTPAPKTINSPPRHQGAMAPK